MQFLSVRGQSHTKIHPVFCFYISHQTGVIWETDVTTKPHKQMNSKSLRHFYFVICQMLVRENKHVTPQQKILVSVCWTYMYIFPFTTFVRMIKWRGRCRKKGNRLWTSTELYILALEYQTTFVLTTLISNTHLCGDFNLTAFTLGCSTWWGRVGTGSPVLKLYSTSFTAQSRAIHHPWWPLGAINL